MPFEQHPMENFNRNNPYVIRAKAKYNDLSGRYEDMMRVLVGTLLVLVLASLIALFASFAINFPIIGILTIIVYCGIYYLIYRYAIKNTILDPANTEIEKVTQMQLNDIMNANLEVVDNAIGIMNECLGKVNLMIDIIPKAACMIYGGCTAVIIGWVVTCLIFV